MGHYDCKSCDATPYEEHSPDCERFGTKPAPTEGTDMNHMGTAGWLERAKKAEQEVVRLRAQLQQAAIAAMQPAPQWQGIESAQRSLMDHIKHDAALVAALPEHERKNYERELRSLFCNPGITFPTPPAGGSDAE